MSDNATSIELGGPMRLRRSIAHLSTRLVTAASTLTSGWVNAFAAGLATIALAIGFKLVVLEAVAGK